MDENLIIENRILKGYKEKLIQTVNIPEGVSAIAENAFADFDFNSDDKVKRKLSNEEFAFLNKFLFKLLCVIILTYESHLEQFDYESDEIRELYWKI